VPTSSRRDLAKPGDTYYESATGYRYCRAARFTLEPELGERRWFSNQFIFSTGCSFVLIASIAAIIARLSKSMQRYLLGDKRCASEGIGRFPP